MQTKAVSTVGHLRVTSEERRAIRCAVAAEDMSGVGEWLARLVRMVIRSELRFDEIEARLGKGGGVPGKG